MWRRVLGAGALGAACLVLATTATAPALFVNFENLLGLTPTSNPVQGGQLNNNSELNDEIAPLRITSGGLSSDPNDTFPAIAGLLDLTGSSLGPARSGTNVVAGLEGGSGGPGSQATIDFKNFVEIRVLQPGFTSVSEWIQLLGAGTTANVSVCGDLNCSDQLAFQTVATSGPFSFTAPSGKEIRNIGVSPVVPTGIDGGAWIDDVTLLPGRDGATVPEPVSTLLLAAGTIGLLAHRRLRK